MGAEDLSGTVGELGRVTGDRVGKVGHAVEARATGPDNRRRAGARAGRAGRLAAGSARGERQVGDCRGCERLRCHRFVTSSIWFKQDGWERAPGRVTRRLPSRTSCLATSPHTVRRSSASAESLAGRGSSVKVARLGGLLERRGVGVDRVQHQQEQVAAGVAWSMHSVQSRVASVRVWSRGRASRLLLGLWRVTLV